jgi:pimeloyl-ACP methyl ester carboxylesterase
VTVSQSPSASAQPSWAHWTEPERIEVDGFATLYRRKGSGPPLVYLHGGGMTRMWLPLYEALAGSFDTIVPEHPGFGDTELPDWLRDFDDLVLHYDALLDILGVEGAHLVGHSLGGWLAANLAIFYPRRFASLTLIAPMGVMVPDAPPADPFRWEPQEALEALFSGAGESYLDYLAQGDEIESALHHYAESIAFARLTWNPRYDWRLDRRLARVQIPTLVIAPEDDRYIPREHCERYAELIPGARLEVLQNTAEERASHLAIVQQPDRLAEMLAEHCLSAGRS